MLTIQPTLSKVAFNGKMFIPEDIESSDEEREYRNHYKEVEEQRDEFKKLASDEDFKMPEPAKKLLKGGAVVTTGVLGGMAAGWGTGKTIKGLEKLNQTKFVKDTKTQLKATNKFIKEAAKTIKTNFLNSEAYKLHNVRLEKARQSKFFGPILKLFGSISKGIKFAYSKIKSCVKYVADKIKGVKSETYKKTAINTVGVSGGIASGVTALKESNEAND